MDVEIRPLEPEDAGWVHSFLMQQVGSTRVVTRGVLYHADKLPGFIASLDGVPKALLTYRIADTELEVITLHAAVPGLGLGSRLLNAARLEAEAQGCRRVWLITSNDNIPAQRFYTRRGMKVVAVHANAIVEARKLKPEIPEFGLGGLPLRDEVEFELALPSDQSAGDRHRHE